MQFASLQALCKVGLDKSGLSYLDVPNLRILVLDTSPENVKAGCFKVTVPGDLNMPLQVGDKEWCSGVRVAVKQCYYPQIASQPGKAPKKVPFDGPTQIPKLMKEVKSTVWADALLTSSYAMIKAYLDQHPNKPLPFKIPQIRFARAAIAIDQSAGPQREAYLLEELIMGKFRKWINNDLPIPLLGADSSEEEVTCATFLAFTQHLQYWMTGKLAFVADYQGA